MNAARLKVLVNRDDYIHQLLNEARSRLLVISRDPVQYRTTLAGLITQVTFEMALFIAFSYQLVIFFCFSVY